MAVVARSTRAQSGDQEVRFTRAPDGTRLAYAIHGSGRLVVASCWLSHLQHDWQSPVWRHFLEDLGAMTTIAPLRRAGLRDVRLERRRLLAGGAPRGPRDASSTRPGSTGSRCMGMSGGSGSGAWPTRSPTRSGSRRLILYGTGLRRPGRLDRRGAGRGGDLPEHDPGRLGEGGSGLPARLHDELHPGGDRGADALVRRPPADVDVAGERGREPDRRASRSTSPTSIGADHARRR